LKFLNLDLLIVEVGLEVDVVSEGSWGDWAIEIKTGKVQLNELRGLLEFSRRNPRFRPLVITSPGNQAAAESAGIASIGDETLKKAGGNSPPAS
jgi:predicted RecB family endonuclease